MGYKTRYSEMDLLNRISERSLKIELGDDCTYILKIEHLKPLKRKKLERIFDRKRDNGNDCRLLLLLLQSGSSISSQERAKI